MRIPVKVTPSVKCTRCTMRYKVTFDECPHCKDKADGRELDEHIEQHHEKLKAGAHLGLYFFVITSVLAAILVLSFLL